MNKRPLGNSVVVLATKSSGESVTPFRDWKFWLPFLLAIASPFIAHKLDARNQDSLFEKNHKQTVDTDQLEQSRREDALRLRTLEELEFAQADYKTARFKVVLDGWDTLVSEAMNEHTRTKSAHYEYNTLLPSELQKIRDLRANVANYYERLEGAMLKAQLVFDDSRSPALFRESAARIAPDAGFTTLYVTHRQILIDALHAAFDKHTEQAGIPLDLKATPLDTAQLSRLEANWATDYNRFFVQVDAKAAAMEKTCLAIYRGKPLPP